MIRTWAACGVAVVLTVILSHCFDQEHDNWHRIDSEFNGQDSQASSLVLSGLSFTAVVCKSLFLWGNALLYRY